MSKEIVDAARVSGDLTNIFCLGPFAKRVSFSAQQTRALNLVWALNEQNEFSSGNSVAVIGAGVAGVTAAAAFIAYGCKVDLFEAARRSMHRQRKTDHRMVHPTINLWPFQEPSLTADGPFLEWHAAKCDEIITNLSDQYDRLKGDNRLLEDTTVTDIYPVATKLLALNTSNDAQGEQTYDLVLLAVGFGHEYPGEDFEHTDYWLPDGLDQIRNEPKRAKTDVIISGCGDGGLIDALRVVHSRFDRGRLVFSTASALVGTEIEESIRRGERAARIANDASGLAAVYEAAAEALVTKPEYATLDQKLRASLIRPPVFLVDKFLSAPYSLWSAPIHKLMIAHARRCGFIIFYKSDVSRQTDTDRIRAGDRSFAAEPASKVVIRHGAKPKFERLIGDAAIAELETRMKVFADFHADRKWPDDYPLPPGVARYEIGTPAFMESKRKLAKRALNAISPDADLSPRGAGFVVQWEDEIPPDAPKALFRVKVENELVPPAFGL